MGRELWINSSALNNPPSKQTALKLYHHHRFFLFSSSFYLHSYTLIVLFLSHTPLRVLGPFFRLSGLSLHETTYIFFSYPEGLMHVKTIFSFDSSKFRILFFYDFLIRYFILEENKKISTLTFLRPLEYRLTPGRRNDGYHTTNNNPFF